MWLGILLKIQWIAFLCLPDSENPRVAVAMIPFLRDRDLRVGKDGEGADELRGQLVSGIESGMKRRR